MHGVDPTLTEAALFGLLRRTLWVGIVAVALYIGGVAMAGRAEVAVAIERVGAYGIAFALLMSSTNYALRFLRWMTFLRGLGVSLRWRTAAGVYMAGFALSATPGKAGEMVRGIILVRHGVPFARNVALFVAERLSDLTAVLILALPGVARVTGGARVTLIGSALLVVAYVGLFVLPWQRLHQHWGQRTGRWFRLAEHVCRAALDTRQCQRPGLLTAGLGLAVLAWTAEAVALERVLHWQGHTLPVWNVFLIYALSRLVGVLSFLPGGIGSTELIMVLTLTQAGVPTADALAATLINRLTTLWYVVALGLASLAWQLRRRAAPAQSLEGEFMESPVAFDKQQAAVISAAPARVVALCVDLDGTLIKGDTLIYSVRLLARRSPWLLPLLPFWLIKGKANLKARIADHVCPSAHELPYDVTLLEWVRGQASNRPVVLATAADYRIAQAVADHLGCFHEVIATRGENLSGHRKAGALTARFGAGNFDYAGNAREDLAVWACARSAIVVDAPVLVEREARVLGKVGRIYRGGVLIDATGE